MSIVVSPILIIWCLACGGALYMFVGGKTCLEACLIKSLGGITHGWLRDRRGESVGHVEFTV